jgi:hypothetical protein
MNRRLLMTPDLLARKRAEMLTDTAWRGAGAASSA